MITKKDFQFIDNEFKKQNSTSKNASNKETFQITMDLIEECLAESID